MFLCRRAVRQRDLSDHVRCGIGSRAPYEEEKTRAGGSGSIGMANEIHAAGPIVSPCRRQAFGLNEHSPSRPLSTKVYGEETPRGTRDAERNLLKLTELLAAGS